MTGIHVHVERDSIAPNGARLTTVVASYPRFIHSELMTHRAFSRNAASSRAIPIGRMIDNVVEHPAMPVEWGSNRRGMQAGEPLEDDLAGECRALWLRARDHAVEVATEMAALGLHKQLVNRILEPWCWITTIISATDWQNFFAQRCHHMAQPEFQALARAIRDARDASTPTPVARGEWHLPFIRPEDLAEESDPYILQRISVARCARVSYLTHDGLRDHEADLQLFERLVNPDPTDVDAPIHASPLEHVATPGGNAKYRSGNFTGWTQFRHFYIGEPSAP